MDKCNNTCKCYRYSGGKVITYHIYPVHSVIDYLKDNSKRHHEDIKDKSVYSDISINWEIYEELSKEGLCYAVLARDGKKTIGYNCYTLTTDLNRNDEILASEVAMFIEPDYRGGLIVDFINECDKLLGTKEVKRVLRSYSDDRIGRILERANYKPRSKIVQKVI